MVDVLVAEGAAVAVIVCLALFAVRAAQHRCVALVALVADLATVGPGATLRNALRRALADPTLDVVYPRVGSGGWVNEGGEPMTAPVAVANRAVTPIERGGKPVAALVHDVALLRHPERLRAAVDAASLAIDNERVKGELRAQVGDVRASRARLLEGADRERRRVERNLHDGAQQRLVGLALTLRLASRRAQGDPAVRELLDEAAQELDEALGDVRELALGIHPAIVTDAGLGVALETLAERPGVPVRLSVDLPGRLPEPVEVGAYYVVAEALANANKHAEAAQVTVQAIIADGALRVAVSDDGHGAAAITRGSGLQGLADRISALGGELVVETAPGSGTTVSANIPLVVPATGNVEQRRLTALRWIGWENWEAPGELYDQLTDEDNLNAVKAVLICGGGSRVTQREREWLIGYQAAAGTAEWVLEVAAIYDGSDSLTEIMSLPAMRAVRRGIVHETLRMCMADGPLDSHEVDCLRQGADAMGVPTDVLAELTTNVNQDHALRRRRYELIVAPVLPAG